VKLIECYLSELQTRAYAVITVDFSLADDRIPVLGGVLRDIVVGVAGALRYQQGG